MERLIDRIIGPMHNRHLNDLEPFLSMNPSAENVALHVGRSLAGSLPSGANTKFLGTLRESFNFRGACLLFSSQTPTPSLKT